MSRLYVSRRNEKGCWIFDEATGEEKYYLNHDVWGLREEVEGVGFNTIEVPDFNIDSKLKLLKNLSCRKDDRGYLIYLRVNDVGCNVVLSELFNGLLEGCLSCDGGQSITYVFDKPMPIEGDIFSDFKAGTTWNRDEFFDFRAVEDPDYIYKLYECIYLNDDRNITIKHVSDEYMRKRLFNRFFTFPPADNIDWSSSTYAGTYAEKDLKVLRRMFSDITVDCFQPRDDVRTRDYILNHCEYPLYTKNNVGTMLNLMPMNAAYELCGYFIKPEWVRKFLLVMSYVAQYPCQDELDAKLYKLVKDIFEELCNRLLSV